MYNHYNSYTTYLIYLFCCCTLSLAFFLHRILRETLLNEKKKKKTNRQVSTLQNIKINAKDVIYFTSYWKQFH